MVGREIQDARPGMMSWYSRALARAVSRVGSFEGIYRFVEREDAWFTLLEKCLTERARSDVV